MLAGLIVFIVLTWLVILVLYIGNDNRDEAERNWNKYREVERQKKNSVRYYGVVYEPKKKRKGLIQYK